NHHRAAAILALNFAVSKGYATVNPAVNTTKVRVIRDDPGILTVEQANALLVNAPSEILPYIAIGLFAGLRRDEIERLDWREVDLDEGHVEVKAKKSKTAQKRFVTMQPNLREWLLPYRKLKGSVAPPRKNWFLLAFDRAREAAGITEWPENA